MHRLKPKIWAY